jgi:hypothetical protein
MCLRDRKGGTDNFGPRRTDFGDSEDGLSHLVARRIFFLLRASPPKILGIVRGLLTNLKSRNLHSIARNY